MKLISKAKETVEKRRKICGECEHNKPNAINVNACELCGCPIYTKTLAPGTHCPDNPPKW